MTAVIHRGGLSFREAGEWLGGVSVDTVERLVRSGRLRAVRVSPRRRLIAESELRRYLESGGYEPDG